MRFLNQTLNFASAFIHPKEVLLSSRRRMRQINFRLYSSEAAPAAVEEKIVDKPGLFVSSRDPKPDSEITNRFFMSTDYFKVHLTQKFKFYTFLEINLRNEGLHSIMSEVQIKISPKSKTLFQFSLFGPR